MGWLRRYTGSRLLVTAWTAVVVAAGVVVLATGRPAHPMVDTLARRAGVVGVVWLFGLGLVWWRDRRVWSEMAATAGFEVQPDAGGRRPGLHGTVAGRTVMVSAEASGPLSRKRTRLRTSVDGVDAGVDLSCRFVGDDRPADDLTLDNPDLDERFAITGEPADLCTSLFTPEVQSAMMDLDVPADLTVRDRAVTLEVPFVRLRSGELRRAATVVALLARRLERVAGDART